MDYVPLEDAARQGSPNEFIRSVRREVLPKLIEHGLLQGKTLDGTPCVLADDAFRRRMGFGIERFVYNQDGWSFVAIQAPIEAVCQALKKHRGVLAYEQHVTPEEMQADAGMEVEDEKRHVFLVKMKNSNWSVLIQTVHWIEQSDMLLGLLLAAELSKTLKTRTIAVWDDDFSGSALVLCERGLKTLALPPGSDGADFYGFFYAEGISLPEAFITVQGDHAALLVEDPAEVERADYLVIGIPTESRSSGPHVFCKLSQMAEAVMKDLEDEQTFCAQTVEEIWKKAQAIREASDH